MLDHYCSWLQKLELVLNYHFEYVDVDFVTIPGLMPEEIMQLRFLNHEPSWKKFPKNLQISDISVLGQSERMAM